MMPQITKRWPKIGLRRLSYPPDFSKVISTADGLVKGDKRVYSGWRLNYLQFIDDQEDLFTLLETKERWDDAELHDLIERYDSLVCSLDDIREVLINVFARSNAADRFAHFPNDETFLIRDIRAFDRQWDGMKEALRKAVDQKFWDIRSLLVRHAEWDEEPFTDGGWVWLLDQAEEARDRAKNMYYD